MNTSLIIHLKKGEENKWIKKIMLLQDTRKKMKRHLINMHIFCSGQKIRL